MRPIEEKAAQQGNTFRLPDVSKKSQYPDIFVIRDSAHMENKKGNPLPALAPVVTQQGKFFGKLPF